LALGVQSVARAEEEIMGAIVVFDGVCNLCNGFVRFIIKRDPKGYFKFTSLQSKKGKQLLKKYKFPADSVVLIEGKKVYTKSTAVLRIFRKLQGAWPVTYPAIILPHILRDPLYNLVSKNRKKWFGEKKTCPVPPKKWKNRFL